MKLLIFVKILPVIVFFRWGHGYFSTHSGWGCPTGTASCLHLYRFLNLGRIWHVYPLAQAHNAHTCIRVLKTPNGIIITWVAVVSTRDGMNTSWAGVLGTQHGMSPKKSRMLRSTWRGNKRWEIGLIHIRKIIIHMHGGMLWMTLFMRKTSRT
jgi:hypothetical protein